MPKTTFPFPQKLGSFLGPIAGNQREGVQCSPLQTFSKEVPIQWGLLGQVGRSYRLYLHRVIQESVHPGITERISPHAGLRGGGPPVKFVDIIRADIHYRNRKPQWLHTTPPPSPTSPKKHSFLG